MKEIGNLLLQVYIRTGASGLAAIVGGIILLYNFSIERNYELRYLYCISGLLLILAAIIIEYIHLQNQKIREQVLLTTVKEICNRLAEQIAKNLNDHQSDTIAQKIRQIIDHATSAITNWDKYSSKD